MLQSNFTKKGLKYKLHKHIVQDTVFKNMTYVVVHVQIINEIPVI